LRTIVNDDELWRNTLRGLNRDFYHQTVTSKQVENYIIKALDMELSGFFEQYLRDARIPTFEYTLEKNTLRYRFSNTVSNFAMPVRVQLDGIEITLPVTTTWQEKSVPQDSTEVTVPIDYYFKIR
jgi:aminopeptidase N